VDEETIAALERFIRSGRRLIMVTGRQLGELMAIFPQFKLFERIVAENGALVYDPATGTETLLTEGPKPEFLEALRGHGVTHLAVGKAIVATWEPHEVAVLRTIQEMGLELQVIFNKGAVMILPTGVTKASGLKAALAQMGLSRHNAVGVGDAENDHALLALCECSAAVANALPALKERADLVTAGDHGSGVRELMERMLDNDLADLEPKLVRHLLSLGDGKAPPVLLTPYGGTTVVAGPAPAGRLPLAAAVFLQRLAEAGYQFCAIGTDVSWAAGDQALALGAPAKAASADQIAQALANPARNVVIDAAAVEEEARGAYVADVLDRLAAARGACARPHWIVIDRLAGRLGDGWSERIAAQPALRQNLLVIVGPGEALGAGVGPYVDTLILGPQAQVGLPRAEWVAAPSDGLHHDEALVWRRGFAEATRIDLMEAPVSIPIADAAAVP
jgi:HAD superfamily hydrolase (TIGR01484 family)